MTFLLFFVACYAVYSYKVVRICYGNNLDSACTPALDCNVLCFYTDRSSLACNAHYAVAFADAEGTDYFPLVVYVAKNFLAACSPSMGIKFSRVYALAYSFFCNYKDAGIFFFFYSDGKL